MVRHFVHSIKEVKCIHSLEKSLSPIHEPKSRLLVIHQMSICPEDKGPGQSYCGVSWNKIVPHTSGSVRDEVDNRQLVYCRTKINEIYP